MRSFRFQTLAVGSALAVTLSAVSAAIPDTILRPDTTNYHRSGSPDIASFPATLNNGEILPAQAPDRSIQLESYSFGDQSLPYLTPYDGYENDVLFNGITLPNGSTYPAVYSQLYPPGFGVPGNNETESGVNLTRQEILNSGAAFRYRWLLFGESDPGDGSPPQILNLFESDGDSSSWFTPEDRNKALAQIEILKEALAYDPLNRRLREALLDAYYDIAVADMQRTRPIRTGVARVRLGLETTDEFVIDEEIREYVKLVDITQEVLDLYADLFSMTLTGVFPTDFRADAGGAPYGYFIFQDTVPTRNQTPTEYASASGNVNQVVEPSEEGPEPSVFSGFKDYRNILNILGQNIQFRSELARLYGMRQADSKVIEGELIEADIALAREQLTLAQETASTVCLLDHMFKEFDFDDVAFDNTGIRAEEALVRNSLAESVNLRGFVNGEANLLGLDPNFLLLVPGTNGVFDTYDFLYQNLIGSNANATDGPLSQATQEFAVARLEYDNFRASVDRVQMELNGLEDDFADRFAEITGFEAFPEGNDPVWDGFLSLPGSELRAVEDNLDSLNARNETLGRITMQLLDEVALADEAVSLADQIDDTITGAEATYLDETSDAWTEIHTWAGAAAASQSITDGVHAAAGVDGASTLLSGGATVKSIIVASVVNTGVQTAAATRTSMREQEIDEAGIAFETKLALAEQPLTVQQARIEAAGLYREALANSLEIQDNFTAIAQVVAEKVALLNEVERLQNNLAGDRESLGNAYFADPVFYQRSERAILKAERKFRNAQRWTYFTARALEYKWQERFAISEGTVAFDISSIFRARNAEELSEVRNQMNNFDLVRVANVGDNPERSTTVISMRDHLLTPNPATQDVQNSQNSDEGLRYDPSLRRVVEKQELFRSILRQSQTTPENPQTGRSGQLIIPFDTTKLEGLGDLFVGASYIQQGNGQPPLVRTGSYLNKIETIIVNIVGNDGPVAPQPPNSNGIQACFVYGGNTFFRSRLAVKADRSPSGEFDQSRDFLGEFVVAPFRRFVDPDFTGSFQIFDTQDAPLKAAYSGRSWNDDLNLQEFLKNNSNGFSDRSLRERSVAATRCALRIDPGQIDLNEIRDIEIIIIHTFKDRPPIQ